MNLNDIVSNDVIIELTGYKTPKKQCELLKQFGVWFIVGRDGRPKTTAEHINNPLASRALPAKDEKSQPNFGAI